MLRISRSALSNTTLALAIALIGCNESATVGSNDEEGSGGRDEGEPGDSTASGEGARDATTSNGTPTSGTSGGGDASSGTGGAGASTSSSSSAGGATSSSTDTTSVTTGSGGGLTDAYVLVSVGAYDGWLQSGTQVSIEVSFVPFDAGMADPEACNTEVQSPQMYVPHDNEDLTGAPVTVSAPGFGTVDAFWLESSKSLVASFPSQLPDGTAVTISFGAAAPIFAGTSLEATARAASFDVPLIEIGQTTSIDYTEGEDFTVAWTSAPLQSSLGAFAVMTTPPNPLPDQVVLHCAAASAVSEHVVAASLMDAVIDDATAKFDAGYGAQLWGSLTLGEEQGREVPTSGNFVTTRATVSFTRPFALVF